MIENDSLAQLVASSRSFQLLTEMMQEDVALRRRVEISMTLREELAGCERALATIATELSNGDCPPEAAVWAAIEYGLAAGAAQAGSKELHGTGRRRMTAAPLTPKQRRFVDEYLVDLNATQAAIRAATARRRPNSRGISSFIILQLQPLSVASAQQDRSERVALDADMVVGGLLLEARREGDGSSHAARVSA